MTASGALVKPLQRVAIVGNSLPRRCGIATFTNDLQVAIDATTAVSPAVLVAMSDGGRDYDYPPAVEFRIPDGNAEDYERAADFLNARGCEVVSLQHEFGIFGGEAGAHVLQLLRRLKMPIVTTLHTVLAAAKPAERRVLREIVDLSSSVIVMAEKARGILEVQYGVPSRKIEVIPHGIPDVPMASPMEAKHRRGFAGRPVLLTFGLLSPNKGIEVMIDAMPTVLTERPDAVYVVLGATHPSLIRSDGEGYRERLQQRVRALGIENAVVFLDQFVDQATLIDFISSCDVYVTPYLNEAQMTSGTLAYSFGLGKAVVSTPYWHAQELLADGRGVLVPFGDSSALGTAVCHLLTDDARRNAMSAHAYTYSRSMTWAATAHRYLNAFEHVLQNDSWRSPLPNGVPAALAARRSNASCLLPRMRLEHFISMCDDTGLMQHAVHSVPDRSHGYCVDDNARALLLACALNSRGEESMPERLTVAFASFVQHAWNRDTRRFRNFMSFDRRWLEESGSEDSHGRVLWALGRCVESDASPSRRAWAAALFAEAVDAARDFRSPRACAFSLLGLQAHRAAATNDEPRYLEIQQVLADRLVAALTAVEGPGWVWFEDELAYDNARLSQALIVTGIATDSSDYRDAGLRSLRWLTGMQTTESGDFRAVGTESFGSHRVPPRRFDQQPIEAAAAVSACLAASRADSDPEWKAHARSAFAWYLGRNDLGQALVDPESGSCRDGLHEDRLNANQGAESVVSYLLALAEIRRLVRSDSHSAARTHVTAGHA